MAISVRKTIIEVDISQALAAEAKLQAANAARRQSAKELADIIEAGEREQIEALKASEREVNRVTAARREQRLEARLALQESIEAERVAREAAKAQAAAAREAGRAQLQAARDVEAARRAAAASEREIRTQRQREAAIEAAEIEHHIALMRQYGAEESAVYRRTIALLDQRIASERRLGNEIGARRAEMQRELAVARDLVREEKKRSEEATDKAFGAAPSSQALSYDISKFEAPTAATNKWAESLKDVRGGFLAIGASVGGIITGIQSAVTLGREIVTLVDDTVRESFEIQSIAKNLQLDIGPAREALQGLVSDKDLALAANKAVAMGVAQTGTEFAHIAEMVSTQAIKLGKDTTQLLSDYVEAVGKQESEIFDNLGLTLRLTDAYQLQADALGKSVKDLTAHEKALAFNRGALLSLEKATGQGAARVDGFANSWVKMSVSVSNMKSGMLGFQDTTGRVNEALRVMTDEEIDRLDRTEKKIWAQGQAADDIQDQLKQWRINLDDLKKVAEEQGVTFDQLLQKARDAHAEQAEALRRAAVEADLAESVVLANEQAEALEHTAKLLDIEGAKKKDVLAVEIQALEVQRDAMIVQAYLTKAAADEAKVRQLNYQIELKTAQMNAPKKGGKKRDPNEQIDLQTAATLRLIRAEEKLVESGLDVQRSTEDEHQLRLQLLELAHEELDVREAAAASRVIKGAKAADKAAAEQLEIITERALLATQRQVLEHERGQAAAEERIALLDREIERQAMLGADVRLLEAQRRIAHRAYVEEFETREELAQVDADLEVGRLVREREARVERAQADVDEHQRRVELLEARGSAEQDYAERRIELEMRVASAAGDADQVRQLLHARELNRIKREVETRKRATDATSNLLTQGMGVFSMVADRAIKDEAKREKAMMRARGVEAMVRGALETVEAVAAFASFNFVQGALHTAAAAVAFGTGISLLAGKVPNKGGEASGAGAGAASGGAEHQTVLPEGQSTARRESVDVPASAEALIRLREGAIGTVQTTASKQGGNVYQIGTIYSGDAGTLINDLDDQTARKWGTP